MNFQINDQFYNNISSTQELHVIMGDASYDDVKVENGMAAFLPIIEFLHDGGRVEADAEIEDDVLDLLFD